MPIMKYQQFQDGQDVMLTVLPLFHINALFYSLAGTLAAGACIVVVPRFSASTFWQTAVAETIALRKSEITAIWADAKSESEADIARLMSALLQRVTQDLLQRLYPSGEFARSRSAHSP